jgi:hypothetical protein
LRLPNAPGRIRWSEAFGVPAAQAHMLSGNGAYAATKVTKTEKAWIKSIRMLGRSLPSYAR